MNTKRFILTSVAAACLVASAQAETLMLQEPSLAKDHLAFVYAGDIYVADKRGQQVKRVTSHAASETSPHISPDGQWIAFSADYDGNQDVYIVSSQGGQPQRLTWHPGPDEVKGWSPDGKQVLFTSYRDIAHNRTGQLFAVDMQGGMPTKMMAAVVFDGELSADGKKLAYNPERLAHGGKNGWRNHRGGTTPPIWIYDLSQHSYTEIPHGNFTDSSPMWVGDDIYYISDRDNHKNIYRYHDGKVSQVTHFTDWDIANADADGTDIVFEKGGALFRLDTQTGESQPISIELQVDLPQRRTQWKDAMPSLTSSQLSTTGKRVLLSARGDIYSVPVKDGSTYNLTNNASANERDGLWSPKGDKLAYITDKGGEYQLVVSDQFGKVQQTLALNEGRGDVFLFEWLNDGQHIVYGDAEAGLRLLDLDSGKRQLVVKSFGVNATSVAGSPDGQWLAYTKVNPNYFSDLYLYNLASGSHYKVTDGMSDNAEPVFSRDGQYLYFASSTNQGPAAFGLDLSSQEQPRRYGLYALVLQQDGQSPLLPKLADETKVESKSDTDDTDKQASPKLAGIDIDNIQQRIVALPVALRNYSNLTSADDNNLYFIESVQVGASVETNGQGLRSSQLKRFNVDSRKVEDVASDINGVSVSADGKQLLLTGNGNSISVAAVGETIKPEALNTADVKALINPMDEWQQIFAEAWRNERDYFYDANMHGLDWQAVYDKYQPLLKHVGRREDLNILMREMISEMQVGHNYIVGGDIHQETPINVGLLGADVTVHKGLYQIAKIYSGELWNPHVKAPLAVPGIKVKVGDYILAIDGQKVNAKTNLYSLLVGKADKQVRLTVSDDGSLDKSRTVVVEPVSSEASLRHLHWVESNRQYVDKASNGQIGYVYLPNTTTAGYTSFNRMYFAQVDKQGMILDERSNGGGQAANYITDVLSRQYLSGWKYRSDEMMFSTPAGAMYGPKVMLIDQDAGSGGDFLPYAFKRLKLGTLIGKTTWGGLIGIYANRPFVDGGTVTVPNFRFFTPDHEWRVENEGVAPDIEVELSPVAVNQGQDPQLDRAIAEVTAKLKTSKPVVHQQAPAFPTELGK
ncbi:S41 family peptidase [Shewanella sp. NIFS-20-20]|uniref:S41 family peptidase n=1 Tax=Shewanella sp. NIFS-20-20 TaxID=2853806 RepID=UPI001C4514FE|nr:S41 family peptidase [Shewanella sp. NIFS-20-20]MBV7317194.1 PDZ domain-containing protein [Shewanella sp. NIFS-20-20]